MSADKLIEPGIDILTLRLTARKASSQLQPVFGSVVFLSALQIAGKSAIMAVIKRKRGDSRAGGIIMDFLIVNGSPKGGNSITLQTSLYLEKRYPEHRFTVLDAGHRLPYWEKHPDEAAEQMREADCIIFSYPVYTFLVPSQLVRFLELVKGTGCDLSGIYATQITTSKHFYDITAHRFIRENAQDMGMRFVEGLSADMEDLLSEKGRTEAEKFFEYLLFNIRNGLSEPADTFPAPSHRPVKAAVCAREKPGRVVIVVDLGGDDGQLARMIARFRARLPLATDVVDLGGIGLRGGCLGCFRCASDGVCVYRDGFADLLRERIQTADAIVTAFTVRDHGMGSLFKMYDDRQFCNGHRTVTMGKPMAALVSGNLPAEENLRNVLESRAETGGNFWCGAACDEVDPAGEIDRVALRLAYAVKTGHTRPANFWGVGGMKIFRDLIWQMQGLMREDHRFFKAHGQYDFPQKHRARMLAMYAVGAMNANPKLRAKLGGRMTEGMLMPYRAVLKKTKPRT